MRRRGWVAVAAALVAAGVVTVAARAGREAVAPGTAPAAPASATPSPTQGQQPAEGFVEFRDDTVGFAVSHPKGWTRLESPDPQVALVATPNGRDSLLVRVVQLGLAVGPEQLPAMQQLTGQIVTANPGVRVLAGPQPIQLGGLAGYFYFYTFDDVPTGQTGAHSHYFLFKGDTMIALVLQALPDTDFERLVPVFDQIADSFRVLP